MAPKILSTASEGASFSAVNRKGSPGYSPGWQRHHLVPRQVLNYRSLEHFFEAIVPYGLGFENFRANGVLLPGTERLAAKRCLPLHRGPHRLYNELVLERVGAIEMTWSRSRNERAATADPGCDRSRRERANFDALERLSLLQRALRRRLLGRSGKPMILNRKDPIGSDVDFSHLDAMADQLWRDTRSN